MYHDIELIILRSMHTHTHTHASVSRLIYANFGTKTQIPCKLRATGATGSFQKPPRRDVAELGVIRLQCTPYYETLAESCKCLMKEVDGFACYKILLCLQTIVVKMYFSRATNVQGTEIKLGVKNDPLQRKTVTNKKRYMLQQQCRLQKEKKNHKTASYIQKLPYVPHFSHYFILNHVSICYGTKERTMRSETELVCSDIWLRK